MYSKSNWIWTELNWSKIYKYYTDFLDKKVRSGSEAYSRFGSDLAKKFRIRPGSKSTTLPATESEVAFKPCLPNRFCVVDPHVFLIIIRKWGLYRNSWSGYSKISVAGISKNRRTITAHSKLLCKRHNQAVKRKSVDIFYQCFRESGSARIHIHFGRLDPDPDPHW